MMNRNDCHTFPSVYKKLFKNEFLSLFRLFFNFYVKFPVSFSKFDSIRVDMWLGSTSVWLVQTYGLN